MYALVIVFAILSPATGTVTPVGVTSQMVGEFKTLDQCKAAANEPLTGGTISDLTLSRGVYWYCINAGTKRLARARGG
jgi:hypothetical protein